MRLLIIITLLALVFSCAGCSKIVRMSPLDVQRSSKDADRLSNASEDKRGNIISVELSSGIIGVALSYEDIISFDTLGGEFDPESKIISGTDINGVQIEIKLDDVKRVIHDSREAFIEFNKNEGRLDAETQLITGLTSGGYWVEIPLDEVLTYKVKKFDYLMTFVAITTLGASIVGLAIYLADYCKGKSPCFGFGPL